MASSRFGGRLRGTTPVSQWLAGGASSFIQSVEFVSVTINSGANPYGETTIGSVDVTRTILVPMGISVSGGALGTNRNDITGARLGLQGATTVRATRSATTTAAITVTGAVVQCKPGVLKSVNYYTLTHAANPTDVSITSVDINKAFVINLGVSDGTTSANVERLQVGLSLLDATTVRGSNAAINSQIAGFVVVEGV